MRKVVFLDRDGVLNKDVSYLYRLEDLEWVNGAKEALAYAHSKGYDLIVVTNQSGIARGYYTVDDMKHLHIHMNEELTKVGAPILHFYYCPHHTDGVVLEFSEDCYCRKPKPGMILRAIEEYDVDTAHSFLIGDSERDVVAANKAGVKGYLFDGSNLLELMKSII